MIEDDEKFQDSTTDALRKVIDGVYDKFVNGKQVRPAKVYDRANEAKNDYLDALPGSLYRVMKEDIGKVWSLLESPIEQVAIFQLAAENYGKPEWPIYAKVARARGMFSHRHYPVQIIPQVQFGRYRVDFLFDLGPRGLYAVECDGEEFHQDWKRDDRRDLALSEHFGVLVLRLTGRQLWRDNTAAVAVADLIRVYLK